jgi:hypothetical protein
VVVTDPAPIAAGNTTAYTGSSGRLCQAFTSSSTAPVIRETVSAGSPVPYTCRRWCRMSRTLIPCAYREMIMSSRPPETRSDRLGTSRGSNMPARSRGTSIPTGPIPVCTFLLIVPLRELPEL